MERNGSDAGKARPTQSVDREHLPDLVRGVDRVLESFHERYVADRAAGRVLSVREYASLYPGFEDVVRERYRRLREEDPPVHIPTTPGPTLAHLVEKGLRDPRPVGEIARGGMGAIYRTRDEVLHRDLAMKVILDEKAFLRVDGQPEGIPAVHASTSLRRMMLEAQITAQLSHPGIVPVHEMGIDKEGRLFFTMKLVHGRTLSDIFRLHREGREGWTLTRTLQVFIRICETLAFAHSKGVIHRDLKPPNVMVGTYGEVYVMDWGIAKVLHQDPGSDPLTVATTFSGLEESEEPVPLTRMGDIVGTPEYMPPEQATGRLHELDRRTDVYSVGAMLYEMLADRPPYSDPSTPRTPVRILQSVMRGPPEPVEALAPDAPAELLAICRKAMARDRGERYQTAEEVANDLHRFLEGRVVLAHRTGPLVELRSWIRRNTAVAWTGAVSFSLLVAGTIGFGLEQQRAAGRIASERDAARAAEARERSERSRAVGLLLAARAAALVEEKPADALQLAVEAAERAPGAESKDALYAALVRHHERRRLLGHDGYAKEGHFSPDGSRVLTREEGGCAILWDAASGTVIRRMIDPVAPVARAVFSPDGTRIALTSEEGRAAIADGASGGILHRLEGHAGPVHGVAFSPDGRSLATGGDGGRVRLWSAGTGQPLRTLEGLPGPILDLAFSPAGDRLAVLDGGGTCSLWEPGTGTRVADLEAVGDRPREEPPPELTRVLFLEGGGLVATWWKATLLRVHDLRGERPRIAIERRGVRWAAASGDGRRLAASILLPGDSACLERWDAAHPGESLVVPVPRLLDGLSLDRTGRRAAAGCGYEGEIWDLDEGRRIALLRGHHYGGVRTAWHPDGERILTVSNDMTARIWMAEPVDAVRLPPGFLRSRASPDGRLRLEIVGSAEGDPVAVEVVDAGGGRSRLFVPGPVRLLRWLPDGTHVLAACDRELLVLRAASGEVRGRVPLPEGTDLRQDTRVEVSADLARAAVPLGNQEIGIADIAAGAWLPRRLPNAIEFALSPDGTVLLTTEGADATGTLWSVESGERRALLAGHTGYVLTAAWSPDGTRVSTGAVEGRIRVWDAATGAIVCLPGPLPMGRNRIDFAAARPWVSAERLGEVTVFDRETGERVFSLKEPGEFGAIDGARFLPGADAIATDTGDGGIVRRWPLDPLVSARERFPVDLDPTVVRKYDLLPPGEAEAYADAWLRRHPTARGTVRRALDRTRQGRLEEADGWIALSRELRPDLAHADWAEACLLARRAAEAPGEPERAALRGRALDALARSLAGKSEFSAALARTEELLAPLRSDPRFRALVGE